MRSDRWKIFNKKGSNLNPFNDSFLNFELETDAQNSRGAEAYAITGPDLYISEVFVVNSGWEYDPNNVNLNLRYTFGDFDRVLTPAEASINFIDVSIFNPAPKNSKGVGTIDISLNEQFNYPSVVYTSAVFMEPVSVGLIETEHLSILEEDVSGNFFRPFDDGTGTNILVFKFREGDDAIRLFEIDQDAQTLIWADELIYDTSELVPNTPLTVNIGFKSEEEGVFERKLRAYHRINGTDYLLAEILVNSQSIGQDERFDTLAQNFGLPNAKNIPKLFKESDINEDNPDWKLLNQKGKHMVLEYNQIMPYIGTYKALINSIKWLGYDDIRVKEWFHNVKDSTKLAFDVPFEAADRTKTILQFSPAERKNLKKLNQLSLVYCITKETGEVDEWGVPEIEECYSYNINEILVKLKSLKDWLEKNIIGVNARIVDVTGEGVYMERFRSLLYSTQDLGQRAVYAQSLTPIALNEASELIQGDSSIRLSLKEIQQTEIKDYDGLKIEDFLQYAWDPSNGAFDVNDPSLYWDPSTVNFGTSFQYPFRDLYDIQWKGSIEKPHSGVLINDFATKPLWIHDNEIKFYNQLDSSSTIYSDPTTSVNLEKGTLRSSDIDIWNDSIAYTFYPDPSDLSKFILESSTGEIYKTYGAISLTPDTGAELIYEWDTNYKAPLLSLEKYKFATADNSTFYLDQKFFLDIEDGTISVSKMDPSTMAKEEYHINFNYDSSLLEQKITLNVVYSSKRMPLVLFDPSEYYYNGPENALVEDNSIYTMNVNHIGDYNMEVFGWDGQNNLYRNFIRDKYNVWTKNPVILSFTDVSSGISLPEGHHDYSDYILTPEEVSTMLIPDQLPIFERQVPLQGLTLEQDSSNNYYIKVPSISYFVDLADPDSIARFYNMTERVISRNVNEFLIDEDYQSFLIGDNVNLALFDRGNYNIIEETAGTVTGRTGNTLTINDVSTQFVTDSSTEVYLLNDTYRITNNPFNYNDTLNIDISAYRFKENQLVGIIVEDTVNNYSWGASMRVIDSSASSSADGYSHNLQGNLPQFIMDNSTRFIISAKHAFSTYTDFNIEVDSAIEDNNDFKIYLKDYYYHQYHLDSTFVYVNLPFDQEPVRDQWYDPSDNGVLITTNYYSHDESITIDTSTMVILTANYDPSTYLLNQKNVWTVRERNSDRLIFETHNYRVPYIFNETGVYDVNVESYDSYGNLKSRSFEGLITVIDS